MKTLNLLVLRCRDLEASRRFYDALDHRFTKHAHGSGPEHYAHEDERGVLELYPSTADAGDKTGLGFGVEDLEAIFQRLLESGYAPRPIRKNPWGRTFVLRDPDDRRVEIKQIVARATRP